jgi:hypothetical protein
VQGDETSSFVSVKAFGDLVIAANCLSRIAMELVDGQVKILLGHHLHPLWQALAPAVEMELIDHIETAVPSLYDVRKNGPFQAAASYQSLRKTLLSRERHPDETLVFDTMGLRERLLSRGLPASALPADTGNIYLGYARFFGLDALPASYAQVQATGSRHALGIFPSARMQERVVPISLIERILQNASASGIATEVVLIDGELPEHRAHFPDAKILPRNFSTLIDTMRSYTHAVSADSLTAHLAEYVGNAVFVFSPVRKEYWLPHSSYIHGRWALFDGAEMAENCSLADFMLL